MKLATCIWLSVAGLAAFLLLGQLFSDYPELRSGVVRLFALLAIAAATVGAVNVLLFAAQQDASEGGIGAALRTPVIASGVVVAAVLSLLLLVMVVGGA